MPAGEHTGRPGPLQIKAAADAFDIKELTGYIQSRHEA
jgi:hypothetical protein